jgi:hypothetical protein
VSAINRWSFNPGIGKRNRKADCLQTIPNVNRWRPDPLDSLSP